MRRAAMARTPFKRKKAVSSTSLKSTENKQSNWPESHSQLDQGALFSKAARHALEPVWAADTQRRINAMGLWPKNLPYPRAALDT